MAKRRFMSYEQISDKDTAEWVGKVAGWVAIAEYGALAEDPSKKEQVFNTCLNMAAVRPEAA